MYEPFNEDEHLIRVGRFATGFGLLGTAGGLAASLLLGVGTFASFLFILLFTYFGAAGYHGAYQMHLWSLRYRYRMPRILWYCLRFGAFVFGIVAGFVGWGAFEHFLLLLSMSVSSGKGIIASQIVLIPGIGQPFASWIGFDPGPKYYEQEEE